MTHHIKQQTQRSGTAAAQRCFFLLAASLAEHVQQFLEEALFLFSIAEVGLTAGEGEFGDVWVSDTQRHNIAVCVPHAPSVGCFWEGTV